TVSVFLMDENGNPLFGTNGGLLVQNDSYPMRGDSPTSGWTVGGYVFDAHPLRLPDALPAGTYRFGVKLYTYWDGAVLTAPDGSAYQVVGTLVVEK
ncbi:MAG TPA: hypothetical protein VHP83_27665, partial [Aggregatilineaceae bacterium]|nr:hypothetical protein [Aggregatilineaceae bacterium]